MQTKAGPWMMVIDDQQGLAVSFGGPQEQGFLGRRRRRPGQSLMEYGLLISLVVVVSVGGLFQLGLSVTQQTRDGVNMFASTSGGGGFLPAGVSGGGPGSSLPGGLGGSNPATIVEGGSGENVTGGAEAIPSQALGGTANVNGEVFNGMPFSGGPSGINGIQDTVETTGFLPASNPTGGAGYSPLSPNTGGTTTEVVGSVGNPTLGGWGGTGALPNQPATGIPGSPDDWINPTLGGGGVAPMPAGGGDWTPNDNNASQGPSAGFSPGSGTGSGGQPEVSGVPGRTFPSAPGSPPLQPGANNGIGSGGQPEVAGTPGWIIPSAGGASPFQPGAGTGSGGQPEVAGMDGVGWGGGVAQPVAGGAGHYNNPQGVGGPNMAAPNMASPFSGNGGYYEPAAMQQNQGGAMPSYGVGW